MTALAHFPRLRDRDADLLDPGRLVARPAAFGYSLLARLDRLGGRTESAWTAHRAEIPKSRRLTPTGALVGAGVLSLVVLLGYGVAGADSGGTSWMTAPGAGNAQAALAASNTGARSAGGKGTAAKPAVAASAHRGSETATLPVVHERLVVLDGGMYGHAGWPTFVGSAHIDFPAKARVDLTIYNYDDGAAPLAKGLPYDKVMGTRSGVETYDGHTISSVSNKVIAHTFTVPGIGLNIPIPAAQDAKGGRIDPAVVEASFVTSKKGSFTWQCYAPCGSGKSGDGGPMKTPGYMTGTVKIG